MKQPQQPKLSTLPKQQHPMRVGESQSQHQKRESQIITHKQQHIGEPRTCSDTKLNEIHPNIVLPAPASLYDEKKLFSPKVGYQKKDSAMILKELGEIIDTSNTKLRHEDVRIAGKSTQASSHKQGSQ